MIDEMVRFLQEGMDLRDVRKSGEDKIFVELMKVGSEPRGAIMFTGPEYGGMWYVLTNDGFSGDTRSAYGVGVILIGLGATGNAEWRPFPATHAARWAKAGRIVAWADKHMENVDWETADFHDITRRAGEGRTSPWCEAYVRQFASEYPCD